MKIGKHNLTITASDMRDFRIVLFGALLNLSFALEKLFIVVGNPLNDVVWLSLYGGFGLILLFCAFHDFLHDEIEEECVLPKKRNGKNKKTSSNGGDRTNNSGNN